MLWLKLDAGAMSRSQALRTLQYLCTLQKKDCTSRREAPRSLKLFPSCRGPIQTEASYVQSQMGKRSVPACSKGQAVTAFG